MADAKLTGLANVQARLTRVPVAAREALRKQLHTEVNDGFIPAVKGAMEAQYDHQDNDHERLIDSVHSYENPNREISLVVIADAKDSEGHFIGSHVEQGHKTPEGKHVAAQPAMWPTWRAFRKGMRRRVSKAARDEIRKTWGGSHGG
jgi:hypothetical protein